jgi:uncharacterized protein YjcR
MRRKTGRRRRSRIKRRAEFDKAGWYLSRGYPLAFIAWKLGVHEQTVKMWNQRRGYAWGIKINLNDRTVQRLISRIHRLEPWHLNDLFRRLTKRYKELRFVAEPELESAGA